MRKASMFLMFLLAPFLAILLVIKGFPTMAQSLIIPTNTINDEIIVLKQETETLGNVVFQLAATIHEQQQVFAQQDEKILFGRCSPSGRRHIFRKDLPEGESDVHKRKVNFLPFQEDVPGAPAIRALSDSNCPKS